MSPLTSLLTTFPAQALAWALVHFLWQGAALSLLAFIVMRWVATTASTRYLVGIATMAAMLTAPLATFVAIGRAAQMDTAGFAMVFSASANLDAATSGSVAGIAPLAFPFIVGAWLVGVVLLSVRLFGGWLVTRRLVHRAIGPVAPEINAIARRVADRLALRQLVRVVESSAVSAPILIGWLKPVVLLPAAALSGLTPSQLEGLLAHELAHIRRHDYLVNLLQSVAETLLFYHPAVWWLSKQIRAEREHCCDDLAVEVCDRLVYVSALTDLAAMTMPRLALGATDGSLLGRVRRILGEPVDARPATGSLAPALVLVLVATIAPIVAAAVPAPVAGLSRGPGADVELSRADQGSTAAPAVEPARRAIKADSLDALRRQLIDTEKEIELLRRQRDDLTRQKAATDFQSQIERATLEVNAIRANVERTKGLVAKGLAGPHDVAAEEMRLALAELNIKSLMQEQSFQTSMADLERRQLERDRLMQRLQQEYVEASHAREQADTDADVLTRQWAAELERQLERRRAELIEAERRASLQQSNDVPAPADLIYRQGPGVVDPRLTKDVQPKYTREAMDAKIQGTVVIEAIIRKDGTVDNARVTKSLDKEHGLDEAALKAARQWLFEPATVKGQPVDYAATIELSFKLK